MMSAAIFLISLDLHSSKAFLGELSRISMVICTSNARMSKPSMRCRENGRKFMPYPQAKRAYPHAAPFRGESGPEGQPRAMGKIPGRASPARISGQGKGIRRGQAAEPRADPGEARLLVSPALITAHDVHNPLKLDTRSDDGVRRLIFRKLRTQKVQKSILDRRRALQPSRYKKERPRL